MGAGIASGKMPDMQTIMAKAFPALMPFFAAKTPSTSVLFNPLWSGPKKFTKLTSDP